jgi:hypothetical protein
MSDERKQPRSVRIRRYQSVTDRVSRRIYKIDRWRLPMPGGLPAISLVYGFGCLAAVGLLSGLPITGQILSLLPWSITWIALPIGGAWVLSTAKIDGRAPHKVLLSIALWWSRPRWLAGLRACPAEGTALSPVDEVVRAPSGDEAAYRRGRIIGPARLVLRYPARVGLEGVPRSARSKSREERIKRAKRITISPGRNRDPLPEAPVFRVPAGREMSFE